VSQYRCTHRRGGAVGTSAASPRPGLSTQAYDATIGGPRYPLNCAGEIAAGITVGALLVPPSLPRNGGRTWCIHRRRAYDSRAITAPETGATSWAFS
jgi:hypothetical protein